MKYINTKTGAKIDTLCALSGGDWVRANDTQDPTTVVVETVPEKAVPKPQPSRETNKIFPDGLEAMTVADLRELAVENGVDLKGITRKDDLISALRA